MSAFQRDQIRLFCKGICLNAPQDACPEGKYPIVQNIRSYQDGTIVGRAGQTLLANSALGGGAIHSIGKLNDPTPFAAAAQWRVFGAGASIFAGATTYANIDTGYSGNPLALLTIAPFAAPNPYMYVGDSSRMRKFDVNGHVYPIGIAPPAVEPTAVTDPLYTGFVFDTGAAPAFIAAGANTGAVTSIFRINTGITYIAYDSGSTGNASVVPTSFVGISKGAIIVFNSVESVPVLETCVAVAPTTIQRIIYDTGSTGLCTIYPTASLGVGQVEAPGLADYLGRNPGYVADPGTLGTPPSASMATPFTTTIRELDFPVNCLVTLGGATENVRILSVSVSPDGVQAFRCVTTGTHSAGDSITGIASFRVNTAGTYAGGNPLQAAAFSCVTTPPAGPPAQTVGGIQSPGGWTIVNNMATINTRATLPDDDLHLSCRLDDCTIIDFVRVYLDVDAVTNDFTQNYYFFEWRPSDLVAAIQSALAAPVATIQDVRSTTVGNTILNNALTQVYDNSAVSNAPLPVQSGLGTASTTTSDQLALGNNQWLDLSAKIGQLTRVGTDPSRTLANVAAVSILVGFHGAAALQHDFSALWISGGFGPDVGGLFAPYTWAFRYRSTTTGARSNPSPAMAAGVIPQRQGVALTGTHSADPQVDVVDWFRMGGVLTGYTYDGTTANGSPPTFHATFRDADIVGGEALDYSYFQPWATTDKQRTGTCTVAGNAVRQTGGTDTFNTSWAAGTPIIINGRTYTLRAQPVSTTLLFLNENAGQGTGLTFTVPVPTLLGQPLPGYWGPDAQTGVTFACGDPNNPGALYWTAPLDADRTSDAQVVIVTSGSEPLMNGCFWDGIPFVWSTENLYQIQPDGRGGWTASITSCGRGLWNRWGQTAASPKGMYFICKDGIGLTAGGSPAILVTDRDLSPLFPHDGVVGLAVNGYNPPDFSQATRMRLSYVNGWLYFDYIDTASVNQTLVMRESDFTWWPDTYAVGVITRLESPGPQVYEELLGGANGSVYTPAGVTDAGTAIVPKLRLVRDQADARRQKIYRDVMIDADLTGTTLSVTPSGSNGSVSMGAAQTFIGTAGRAEYLANINSAQGTLASNLVVDLSWTQAAAHTPQLFVVDAGYQPNVELAENWLSGPTTHGLRGWQVASYAWVAYLATAACTLTVIVDGVTYTYALPSTSGAYAKTFLWFKTVKGLLFQYGLQSTAPCLLFHDDTEIYVTPFGRNDYQRTLPFAQSTKAS